MKKCTNQIQGSVKMRGQKDLRTMKNGINKIKIQRESWYKMLQNGQMMDFGKKTTKFW